MSVNKVSMGSSCSKRAIASLAFAVAIRIDWEEGPVEITAEEALASDPKAEVKKIDAAEAWLRTRLMPGPVPAKQIEDEVEAAGFWSLKTVERAGEKMGVTKQKDGFQGVSVWAYKPGA
jgi:hypothetical protein